MGLRISMQAWEEAPRYALLPETGLIASSAGPCLPKLTNICMQRKSKAAPKVNKQYFMNAAICPQLDKALRLLPPRPYTGKKYRVEML